jgi:heme/copper-type cytochrome/quinol oxidase subunit 1
MSSPSTGRLFTAASVAALGGAAVAVVFPGHRGIDVFYHDRYFVLTYAEISLALAVLFGVCAAVYLAFPRIFHRGMSEGLGKAHFCLTLGCAALVLACSLSGLIQKASLTILLAVYSAALALAASPILLLVNLFWSLWKRS